MPDYGEDMGLHRLGLEVGLGGGWKWRSEVKIEVRVKVKFRAGGLAAGFHPVLASRFPCWPGGFAWHPPWEADAGQAVVEVSLPLEQQRLQASRQCEGKGTLGSWKSVGGGGLGVQGACP